MIMDENRKQTPGEGISLVRICVPELNVQKCLQFSRDQLVREIKQQCLSALPKDLKESFNYGLFYPPENGRAGKFLDEERKMGDYPFNEPVGHLELKYKRRIYKTLSLDEKNLKTLHTRANFKRFLEFVHSSQVEKIIKICSKGFDPNFHCPESGETPLTLATTVKKPSKIIVALLNGGALLDYRTKDGSTVMHRAIEHNSLEALQTLLELGASPNYKDSKGVTPIYLTITHNSDPKFTEVLLHNHAAIGAKDLHGWNEVHQACKNAQLEHLEYLLCYGADMNARNASGNTPLHVCAVNNQIACAQTLLIRGADKNAFNFANQTPYQVAVIAQNMKLADIIQNHNDQNIAAGAPKACPDEGRAGNSPGGMLPTYCVNKFKSSSNNNIQADVANNSTSLHGCRNAGVTGKRESKLNHFLTAPRSKKNNSNLITNTRTVILHKGRKGFGFILRGAKATSPLMELTPSEKCPALQYLDDVDAGGVADLAGLKKGDFLLEINDEDVSSSSHEHVVDAIRKSGNLVKMTVVSLELQPSSSVTPQCALTIFPLENLEYSTQKQFTTLPRILYNPLKKNLVKSARAPLPPRRDPKTTLTIDRSRSKCFVTESDYKNMESPTSVIQRSPLSATNVETNLNVQKGSYSTKDSRNKLSNYLLENCYDVPKHQNYYSNKEGYVHMSEGKRNKKVNLKSVTFKSFQLGRKFHSLPDLFEQATISSPIRRYRSQEELSASFTRNLPPPILLALQEFFVSRSAHQDEQDNAEYVEGQSKAANEHINIPYLDPSESNIDCSSSESDLENNVNHGNMSKKSLVRTKAMWYQLAENTGNSCTSGSSSASSSILHMFSPGEIRRRRMTLKSSRSYPDNSLKETFRSDIVTVDGDSSSSGVSSDQENHPVDAGKNLNSAGAFLSSESQKCRQGLHSRHAVSLLQLLPPPIELEQEEKEKEEFCLPPPPPEFETGLMTVPPTAVLAPPPQFSDPQVTSRVKFVDVLSKSVASKTHLNKIRQGRLHSQ